MTKAALNEGKHAGIQHIAEEIWQKRPNTSKRQVAKEISKETGDKPETIRKVIKKKR